MSPDPQTFEFTTTNDEKNGTADSSTTASQAQERAQQAAGQAQQAAGQAQEKAQHAAGQAQDKLREQIDQRSAQAAEQINAQASDLRSVSEALRKEGKDGRADAPDRLAEYAEKVGGYLHDKDSYALLGDAEDFGRERPWAAAAGGLAIGFAASRFLKASSSRRYQSQGSSGKPSTPPRSDSEENTSAIGYAGTSGLAESPINAGDISLEDGSIPGVAS